MGEVHWERANLVTVDLAHIHHLLIDLDGVLYRGDMPLPHAAEMIGWLRDRGLTYRLVTNNSTLTPEQYVTKLGRMGIAVDRAEVFTSALATGMYLRQHAEPGQTAYVIGEDGLCDAVEGAGLELSGEGAHWVVVGLDRHLTYEKLTTAVLSIEAGAGFVGSNPDTSLPTERGLLPGAGAILRAIEAATGVEPVVIGKPKPLMLHLALEHLGGTSRDTAMLGDRLDTDIGAAEAAGLPSILVLTGVSTRADLQGSSYHPDLVVDDLKDLMERWTKAG